MKLNTLNSALRAIFALFVTITAKTVAQETRERYIVAYHDGMNPFRQNVNISSSDLELLMHADKNSFVGATLSNAEVKYLQGAVGINGAVTKNNIFVLDDTISPHNPQKLMSSLDSNSTYLDDTPHCIAPLNNVDFIVIDTLISTNNPELSNVTVTLGPNFTPHKKSCNTHATQVASVIAGNSVGVIPQGDRTIYNIATFNCSGLTNAENLIKAFNAAIDFSKDRACHGRRTIVNFSGIGVNKAVNIAATAVVNSGIPLFTAAGNSGVDICNFGSPMMADKVFSIGATAASGNVPTDFTNFGPLCVKIFLPGEGIMVASINGTIKVDGTSFSSPIGAAFGGLEFGLDLQAKPEQVYERITARPRTMLVNPPSYANFHTPMRVMLAAYACPAESRIFNHLIAKKKPIQQPIWYNGIRNNNFCVSFNAKSATGAILIKLRKNETSADFVTVKIGDNKHLQGPFVNTIKQDGMLLDSSNTAPLLLSKKTTAIYTIIANSEQLSVMYEKEDGIHKTLLFTPLGQQMHKLAFNNLGGAVTYNNALKCLV